MSWFDESRLDDERALSGVDLRLRTLAESGARVRRESADCAEAIEQAVDNASGSRPRAVIAAGPDSRLLRAVLEPWCPVPFVAWAHPTLPGWAGSMDLVVVLAPEGDDRGTASAVAEGVRRGCQVVVAAPTASLVAEHAAGRWSTVLPSTTHDQLATAVVVLELLHRIGLGPVAGPEQVAHALDEVAIACSPSRDIAVNPGKILAISCAEANPLLWGGSPVAARAARRVAESLRRASGRSAIAGDTEQLLPVLEATRPRDVFNDPFADGAGELRPLLLVLEDGSSDPVVGAQRARLVAAADERGVRVEHLRPESADVGSEMACYASLVLSGTYGAEYLRLGLVED